jgi:hypothetical protein
MTHTVLPPLPRPTSSPYETTPIKLLNLAIAAVFIAWLTTACYALAYLVSH